TSSGSGSVVTNVVQNTGGITVTKGNVIPSVGSGLVVNSGVVEVDNTVVRTTGGQNILGTKNFINGVHESRFDGALRYIRTDANGGSLGINKGGNGTPFVFSFNRVGGGGNVWFRGATTSSSGDTGGDGYNFDNTVTGHQQL